MGSCQAGSSCPFSHSTGETNNESPPLCKYFQKGNCKFGIKCALTHVLQDGSKVSSPQMYHKSPVLHQHPQLASTSVPASAPGPTTTAALPPINTSGVTTGAGSFGSIWSSPQQPSSWLNTPNQMSYISQTTPVASFGANLSFGSTWTNSASAILDEYSDADSEDDELVLVPSSLNDLLTPQQVSRRRSSQSKMERSSGFFKSPPSSNSTNGGLMFNLGGSANAGSVYHPIVESVNDHDTQFLME